MNPRSRLLGFAIAGLTLAAMTAGVVVAATPSVTNGNVDVIRRTKANVNLENTGGALKTVLSVTLPAGSWVLTADVSALNFGTSDYVRCGIYAGATSLGASVALIGSADTRAATLNATGGIKSSSPISARLRCTHDVTMSGIYIDAGATLWAHRSTSLNLPS